MKSLVLDGKTVKSCYINGKLWYQDTPQVQYKGLCIDCTVTSPAGGTIAIVKKGTPPDCRFEYSYDGVTWIDYIFGTTIDVKTDTKIYMQSFWKTPRALASGASNHYFRILGDMQVKLSGSVRSLLLKGFESYRGLDDYALFGVFYDVTAPNTTIVDASDLDFDMDVAHKYCCRQMFYNCNNLVYAPRKLGAMTLYTSCYQQMFYNCNNLITAPELPATTTEKDCYKQMFYNCKNLQSLKVHFNQWTVGTTTTAFTSSWLYGTSTSGVFTCPSALPITTRSTTYVPDGWTIERF